MVGSSIQELIAAARDGDERAWKELFQRYIDTVWKATSGFGLSCADREDIAQESFIRFVQHIRKYDPAKSSVGTYLSVIAKRICIDVTRRRQPKTVSIEEPGLQIPAPRKADDHTIALLRDAMEGDLSAEQRLCVQLFYYQSLSYQEVAEALAREYHWVKNTLHRARTLLKEGLEKRLENRRRSDAASV